MIKLAMPSIEEEDIEAVSHVLKSCQLVQGEQVASFEEVLSNKLEGGKTLAVSSGTAALHLALLGLKVQPHDMVIVPTYSFPATANVVEICGATPIFVDIKEDDFTMDPEMLEKTIKDLQKSPETAKKLKAIIVVHAFGTMADMKEIMMIADRYHLPVIEDAACSLGASLEGIPSGRFGSIGCFSFHPRKVVTTGEGGAIVTQDPELFRLMKAYRNHGQELNAEGKIEFIVPGLNYRITEFQAALGQVQLNKLDRLLKVRRLVAERYDSLLNKTNIRIPHSITSKVNTYQSYVALLPASEDGKRDQIIQKLKSEKIETTVGTYHIPMTSYYRNRYGFKIGDFPVTERVANRSITLPMPPNITENDQRFIVEKLLSSLNH